MLSFLIVEIAINAIIESLQETCNFRTSGVQFIREILDQDDNQLSTGNSKESVSVSFHYFEKGIRQDDGSFDQSPFSKDEFSELVNKIETQPEPDLDNANDFDGLKFGRLVPFLDLEKIDERTLFGRF